MRRGQERFNTRVIAALVSVGVMGGVLAVTATLAAGSLPDGRGWEMVSPLEKDGADVRSIGAISGGGVVQAAPNGEGITYVSLGSFGIPQGATLGNQYLSVRGGAGWSTQNISLPTVQEAYGVSGAGGPYKAFSSDLSKALVVNAESPLPTKNMPLGGAPQGYKDFYLRDDLGGGLQALLTSPPNEAANKFQLELRGATSDLSHVVVATDAILAAGAIDEGELARNLYEWSSGGFQSVNVLPNGTPAPGAFLGARFTAFGGHAVSEDGSRVFWTYLHEAETSLYVRENGQSTVQVDATQGPGPGGEGVFRLASSDGSKVFFTDKHQLTAEATARNGGEDLYEFNVNTGDLTDLTPDANVSDESGANVGGVMGANEGGSVVYFVASGVLTGTNAEGRSPVAGQPNMYSWHAGLTTFIATLAPEDESESEVPGIAHDWSLGLAGRTTRVTANGEDVIFMSSASLTGYNNEDAVSHTPDGEVYLYDAAAEKLSCASCRPSGAQPTGASRIPGGTVYEAGGGVLGSALYQSRALSADGKRVFFMSSDALVTLDSNNQQDVYEYENGAPQLISSGTSDDASSFVDASANASDVFFVTRQQLVPGDTDQLVDLYDARVDGGFPASATVLAPCEGEGCKAPVSPAPLFNEPASATFSGAGNLAPPVVKPVAKKKAKKKVEKKPKKVKERAKKAKGRSHAAEHSTTTHKTRKGGR
jgi:hypothetical protein